MNTPSFFGCERASSHTNLLSLTRYQPSRIDVMDHLIEMSSLLIFFLPRSPSQLAQSTSCCCWPVCRETYSLILRLAIKFLQRSSPTVVMHLSSLLLLSSLISSSFLSYAVPLIPQPHAVRRRATYSVIAVDGGAAATSSLSNAPSTTTIITTSDQIETVFAPTVTITPSKETLTSTAVVSTPEPTKTIKVSVTRDLTKTLSLSSTSRQESTYAVVDAGNSQTSATTTAYIMQTSKVTTTVDQTSSTLFRTSSSTSASSSLLIPSPSTTPPVVPVIQSSSVSHLAAPLGAIFPAGTTPLPAGLAPISISSTISSSIEPTTSSRTYDNGLWHTTYRSWNATLTVPSLSATASSAHGTHTYRLRNKG